METEELEKLGLSEITHGGLIAFNGGTYMPGAGPGGIGHVLTREQAKYLFHEIGDFFRGFWDGL